MSRPLLLDLFCCEGGAAMGYHRAGFDVIGVDIEPQPNYPFEFCHADAIGLVRSMANTGDWKIHGRNVGAIHASPPCQSFTAYRRRGDGVGDGYPNLIGPTRELLIRSGRPYVIENVQGAPLRDPVVLCGSMFGLDVRRHRLFESNFALSAPRCDHGVWTDRKYPGATNRPNGRFTCEVGVYRIPLDRQREAMGVDWTVTLRGLSEAIPPAYTEFIGRQLLAQLEEIAA